MAKAKKITHHMYINDSGEMGVSGPFAVSNLSESIGQTINDLIVNGPVTVLEKGHRIVIQQGGRDFCHWVALDREGDEILLSTGD